MGIREIDLDTARTFLTTTGSNIIAKTKENTMTVIKTFVNEYDVTMLEIKAEHRRPVHISEKKALAILATNDDATLLEPIVKHGRDLFQVAHLEGDRSFCVGEKKIKLVLDNAAGINEALTA